MKFNKALIGSLILAASASLFLVDFSTDDKTAHFTPRTQHSDQTYFNNLHGIAGAIEYYNERRKNIKTGKIEVADMIKAERAVANFGKTSKQASLGLNWIEMGPDNVGGRTRALIVDQTNPAKLFAGAVGGGLFVSHTYGYSWSPVNDKMSTLAIASMCQSKDGDIYVGTGENFTTTLGLGTVVTPGFLGRGVFKSTDGGVTFDSLPSTVPTPPNTISPEPAWAFVSRLAADPFDNDLIYAATSNGLMVTTDGGTTWDWAICLNPPNCTSFNKGNFQDVKIGSNGVVVASSGGSTYLLKPGATNFVNISGNFSPGGSRFEFAIAPSDPDYIYVVIGSGGNMGGLWQSIDGGDNWTLQVPAGPAGVFNGQASYDMALAVFPDDPRHILVGGVELWAWSGTDNTWDLIALTEKFAQGLYVHADKHVFAFPPDYNTSQTYYIGCDGGVYRAYVGSPTYYSNLNSGYNVTQFYAMGVSREGWIGGGTQDNGNPFIDFTGNTELSEVYNLPSGDGGYMQFSIINPDAFFWESQGGDANRSPEKGAASSDFFNAVMCQGPCDEGTNEGPWVTPLVIWESFNDLTSTDSVRFIATQAYNAGTTIFLPSNNENFPFEYVTPVPLSVNDTVMIQDIVQNKFVTSTYEGTWMCKNVLDFSTDPAWYKISTIQAATCAEFSADGDILYIGKSGVVSRISGLLSIGPNDPNTGTPPGNPGVPSGVTTQTVFSSGQQVTGIGVDPNNSENVVITTGNYGSTDHVYLSSNAATTLATNTFNSIQGDLPAMPCYDAIIEMTDTNVVIVGTEYGVWATDNAWSVSPTWTNENNSYPRAPTFMVLQQRMPNSKCTGVINSGNIYVATHGRGIWRTENYAALQDTVTCTLPIGIKEWSPSSNFDIALYLHPNPVTNGSALVTYTLNDVANVEITLYDITGKQLKSIVLNTQTTGEHTMDLDCRNLKAGTYFVSMTANGIRRTKRLVVL